MENTPAQKHIVVAGAGYAGLHVAQRLGSWLDAHRDVDLTLVDRNDYHQLMIELPRVAAGLRAEDAVRVPLDPVLSPRVAFLRASVSGFDLVNRALRTDAGPVPYDWLVLALGSRPNDFAIPGLADRVLFMWSAEDAEHVWQAVNESVRAAAAAKDPDEQRRLMTVVIGGGGATGVELAGGFAEELPALAREYGAPPDLAQVVIVEAGHTILAGSSPELIAKADAILRDLHVRVSVNSMIVSATAEGFKLKNGEVVSGGVFLWAGGVKAPDFTDGCGLAVGYNGRIKVDRYLRALDHPEVFVAGDLASVIDPETGRALPPLAQTALEEGETVAQNVRAAVEGKPLEPFKFRNKGFVVAVGEHKGVADIAGLTIGGRLAHLLKDSIEWEYRQSVKHLRGWGAI